MKKNIFIVDDDELFTSMLQNHLLKNKSLEVFIYSTGEAALNDVFREPVVVILDYHLNTVVQNAANGLDILKEFKRYLPKVHAIMLSSQTKYGVAVSSIMDGAEQYVMKDGKAFETIDAIVMEIISNY